MNRVSTPCSDAVDPPPQPSRDLLGVLPRLLRNAVDALLQPNRHLLGVFPRFLRNAVQPMLDTVDAALDTVDPFPKGHEPLIRALPKSRNRLIRVLA